MIDVQEVITDSRILANRYILRNGFPFTAITHPANVYDAVVVNIHKMCQVSPQE